MDLASLEFCYSIDNMKRSLHQFICRYWVRDDGGLLENSTKYRMVVLERSGYKSKMVLHIYRMNSEDFIHRYYCVAKNDIQKTVGEIQVYGNVEFIENVV